MAEGDWSALCADAVIEIMSWLPAVIHVRRKRFNCSLSVAYRLNGRLITAPDVHIHARNDRRQPLQKYPRWVALRVFSRANMKVSGDHEVTLEFIYRAIIDSAPTGNLNTEYYLPTLAPLRGNLIQFNGTGEPHDYNEFSRLKHLFINNIKKLQRGQITGLVKLGVKIDISYININLATISDHADVLRELVDAISEGRLEQNLISINHLTTYVSGHITAVLMTCAGRCYFGGLLEQYNALPVNNFTSYVTLLNQVTAEFLDKFEKLRELHIESLASIEHLAVTCGRGLAKVAAGYRGHINVEQLEQFALRHDLNIYVERKYSRIHISPGFKFVCDEGYESAASWKIIMSQC